MKGSKKHIVARHWLSSSQGVGSLRHLMDAWYDGTSSGTQLNDVSGNGRHATLTSNLITLSNTTSNETSWFQSGGTAPSVNTLITSDLATGGTHSMRFRWESVAAFFTHRSQSFVLLSGESVTLTFWAKKVTNSLVNWIIRMGNGSTNGVSSTLSANTHLIAGSQAVGSWGQYRCTFTNTQSGGLAHFLFNGGTGTHEILVDKDITVTISGQTNICFKLPIDATLAASDVRNRFYTSAAVPKTIRGAYEYGAHRNDKIFCGGAFSYIFLTNAPDILTSAGRNTLKMIHRDFRNLDHYFDSCPNVLTVGSGQTYATIQLALAAISGNSIDNRFRIDVYNDLSVSTLAGYTVTIGSNQAYISVNKAFACISRAGATNINITCTKEDDSSDAEMGSTEVLAPVFNCGIRGINFTKRNGGYLVHQHFSGNEDAHVIYKDVSAIDEGSEDIINYRIANAQPPGTISNGKNAFAGGLLPNFRLEIEDCYFEGIYPFTYHDADCDTAGGKIFIRNTQFESTPLFDPTWNPDEEIQSSVLFTSHGGDFDSYAALDGITRNSVIEEEGAVKTIFYEVY